jgi:hypothetical protein
MKKKENVVNEVIEGTMELGSDAAMALMGLSTAGTKGLLVSGLLIAGKRILTSALTQKEKDRVDVVYKMAVEQIMERLKNGSIPRKDLNKERYIELTEGTLLKAKDSYQEKKLPLIANLLATAPFTHTPIENMNQTLIYAEQLSYRQLCELAVIGRNEWGNALKLSDEPLFRKNAKHRINEEVQGVYSEINHLLVIGIIEQELSPGAGPAISSGMYMFSPAKLRLLYPGMLLSSGMRLDEVDKRVFNQIVKVLKS